MSLTYNTYVSQLSNLTVIPSSDPNFVTMLPGAIDYAEQRIYRDANLENVKVTNTSLLNANTRFTDMPLIVPGSTTGFQTVLSANVLVGPFRYPMTRSWRKMIDFLYPLEGGGGIPVIYDIIGTDGTINKTIMVGPPAVAAYGLELYGTIRPYSLSAIIQTTVLTNLFPDLFVAASMVFASGYMRDFGGQGADNPNMGQSWETQYSKLLQSVQTEQMRGRYKESIAGAADAKDVEL